MLPSLLNSQVNINRVLFKPGFKHRAAARLISDRTVEGQKIELDKYAEKCIFTIVQSLLFGYIETSLFM